MSVEDLKKYGALAASDPKVRAEAKRIGLTNVEGQASYARTLGFNFDIEDMKTLARENQPKGELSEAELQKIAGGLGMATAALAVTVATSIATVSVATTAGDGW